MRVKLVGFGIALALALTACAGSSSNTPSSPSEHPTATQNPSPSPSPSSSPTQSPSPTPGPRFESIEDALAFIRATIHVPILYPSEIPADIRLANVHPVEIYDNYGPNRPPTAALELRFGTKGFLRIEYGAPTWAGCDAEFEKLDETHVGGVPAVLGSSGDHSGVIWPATFKKLQGRYKLDGSFTAEEILRLAESMRPLPASGPMTPPPAC